MKLVVFGGRDFINYHATEVICNKLTDVTTLIHGGAIGADTCGRLWDEKKVDSFQKSYPNILLCIISLFSQLYMY